MCGWCMEYNTIVQLGDHAADGTAWVPAWIGDLIPYLQETADLPDGCRYLSTYAYDAEVCSTVLLCRVLDVLMTYGMTSTYTQQLLAHETIQWAITHACRPAVRAAIQAEPASLLPEDLIWLYDAETYHDPAIWAWVRSRPDPLVHACQQALHRYWDWWLFGQGLPQAEREVAPILIPVGSVDPVHIGPTEAEQRFQQAFRGWLFSVLLLGTLPRAQPVLFELITHDPDRRVDFDGLDLWLQRQAIVQLVRTAGASVLIPYNPTIRPQLVYYAALKAPLSPWEQYQLATAMAAVDADQHAWGAELVECRERLADAW
jgi:hypothetical protein